MSAETRATVVIRPRLPGFRERVRELVAHYRLIPYFGRRAIERLYARTVLGRAWIVLRPTLGVAARAFFYGGILAAPSAGVPYLLFLVVGMTAWSALDRTLNWVTRSIEMNRRLVSQTYFPRLVLPFAGIAPALVELAVFAGLSAFAFLVFGLIDGVQYLNLSWELIYAVAAVVILMALAVGAGLWTSVLGASTRDMRWSLRYVVEVLFFVTPVAYTLEGVPEAYRGIVAANPLTPVLELFRLGVFGEGEVNMGMLAFMLVLIVATWVGGLIFFTRVEAASIDRI